MKEITINYIISQIFAFLAFIFSIIAYHRSKKEKIMSNMVMSNTLNLIHYMLLGAYSGAVTKILAILRDLIIIIKEKKKIPERLILAGFIIAYTVIGIVTFESIVALLPLVAALIYLISIYNGNELRIKIASASTYVLWLIYNIYVFSIMGIIATTISIISGCIAIYRYKKKEAK